ncbi:hypothetical protein H5V45_12155 [Nocardioides sp. KIGAM211]|uniref:ABC-2 type transport system permease protein n=1 Tax=Nocardioides luti TaxID=2761101 RepID=A0A7X0RGY5_9ACTN|nr:hypothetical protein [Nocardioides luti]MBB6628072.1 hypothetical protein [Nocardioides luti]
MPTAASSTDRLAPTRRAVADVGHLLRFRARAVRRRASVVLLAATFLAVTAAAAVVPALVPGAADGPHASDVRLLLPSGLAGFLALAVVSAVASGGGRELIAHEHAVVHPVSPTTDHLGALLLAPLNIAWLLQGWLLLGSTAYAFGPGRLLPAQLGTLLWLAAATAVAQVVAWSVEWVRRGPHGVATVRVAGVVVAAAVLVLQVTGRLTAVLDRMPTVAVVAGYVDGFSWRWLATVGAEVALLGAAVVLGAVPAHAAARRTPRDELRLESDLHPARPMPRSLLGALLRTDRASVWRAVPMRRGLAVLAVGPGVVAIIGDLPWHAMTVLPGLVASGGALLFGVNAWCLDGRGGLWRESLPVPASTVFAARSLVLGEFLLAASAVTIALSSLRAGVPTPSEAAAMLATSVVVLVQVVAAAMRWSDRRPLAVDLRSARATPAPPLAMVGYSTRLAVSTTVTGLVFSGLARVDDWWVAPLVAVTFVAWSTARLLRTRRRWLDPVARSRVVTTVAA